jgi:hypothetical protein
VLPLVSFHKILSNHTGLLFVARIDDQSVLFCFLILIYSQKSNMVMTENNINDIISRLLDFYEKKGISSIDLGVLELMMLVKI